MDTAVAPMEDLNDLSWNDEPVDEDFNAEVVPEPEPDVELDAPEESGETENVAPPENPELVPEWIVQADTMMEAFGGREYLADVIDYAQRLFGIHTDGVGFLDKLQQNVPGVYQAIEREILGRQGNEITPEIEAQVLERLGLNVANAENYRLLDQYGYDIDVINANERQRDFLDTLTPADRQTFINAPADIKEQLVQAFEKGWTTTVRRGLDGERAEQQAKQEKADSAYKDKVDAEVKLGSDTNIIINKAINGLNAEYATALKLPATYVEGIMTRALLAMQGTAKEGEGVALHYERLREGVAEGNWAKQNNAIQSLKPYVDAAFRAEIEKEKQDYGEYNFQGFFAAPKPKAPTVPTAPTAERQFEPEQPTRINPAEADLNQILFGRAG